MRHTKKYKSLFSSIEQAKLRSRARSLAKHSLSKKHKSEYDKLLIYYFNKVRGEELKKTKYNFSLKRKVRNE